MKKVLLLLICIFIIPVVVNATSGRLKKDTIKICGGTYYGQHGDNNHWHTAEKNGDFWYATGPELSYNPCEDIVITQNENNTSYSSETQPSNDLSSDSYNENSNSTYESNSFVSSSNEVNLEDTENITEQTINDETEVASDIENDFEEEEEEVTRKNVDNKSVSLNEESSDESSSAVDGIIGLGVLAGIGACYFKSKKK